MTEEQFRNLIGEVEAFCEEHDSGTDQCGSGDKSGGPADFCAGRGGRNRKERCASTWRGIKKETRSVLCGSVGLEGALRILEEQEADLSQRFVPAFLRQTKALKRELCPLTALKAAVPHVRAMQQIGSGGDPGGALGTVRGGRSRISGCDGTDDDLSGDGGDL